MAIPAAVKQGLERISYPGKNYFLFSGIRSIKKKNVVAYALRYILLNAKC